MDVVAPVRLLLVLPLGIFALVAAILGTVFFLIGRALDRERARLDAEGVVMASSRVVITTRYKNFRAPGLRSTSYRKKPGYLVLTRERLLVLERPQRYGVFARGDLGCFQVGVLEGGVLRLYSDEPPGATGSVDYRVPVRDPASWMNALIEAGVRAP